MTSSHLKKPDAGCCILGKMKKTKSVNRAAVIVRPKDPFLKWVNNLSPEKEYTLEDLCDECTVFLIPEYDQLEEAGDFIKINFKVIFRFELEGWCNDPKYFPGKLTYKMFKEWLELRL